MFFWVIFVLFGAVAFVFNRVYLLKIKWMRRSTALLIQHAVFMFPLMSVARYSVELGLIGDGDLMDPEYLFVGCAILFVVFGLLSAVFLGIDMLYRRKDMTAK